MTLVVDLFQQLLPNRTKISPSGWTSFNAPCCGHRGHSSDTRKRGGVRFDHGIVYNCFNCKFTASWQPGRPISGKLRSLLKWMGANDSEINKIIFEALKTESEEYKETEHQGRVQFEPKELPEGSLTLVEWMNATIEPDLEEQLLAVVQYVINRGYDPLSELFYWSPLNGFESRVIIPFKYHGKVVGYTARKVNGGKPKYLSDQHPHFVFNVDAQKDSRQYLFVCEGPFDALAVDGVALLTNGIADQQARIINSLGKKVIVIPDQDKAGLELFDRAAELGWAIASPTWEDDVKDSADAVERYGKLFVIVDAIKTASDGEIKIRVARNKLEHKLTRLETYENT